MTHAHLLIADDSKTKRALFSQKFQNAGYQVSQASDGLDAIEQIMKVLPDLVLVDYDMPNLTGIEVLEWMHDRALNIPAILMTAYGTDELHTRSFELGGDDYLQLPISFNIMLAHVQARLRKHAALLGTLEKIRFADVEVDTRSHTARKGSRLLDLTPAEYRLLVQFLRNPLRVLTRDQIIEQAWGYDFEGNPQIVDHYVGTLRKKLEADDNKRLIHTVRGFGYKLYEPQTELII